LRIFFISQIHIRAFTRVKDWLIPTEDQPVRSSPTREYYSKRESAEENPEETGGKLRA